MPRTALFACALAVVLIPVVAQPAAAAARVPANTLATIPPMGWNSWNKFNCGIDETKIKAAADGLVSSGMRDAGYRYVNIDDCWAEHDRDASGNLVPHHTKFPHGIKAIADYVHGLGLKLGIYSSAGTSTCTGPAGVGAQPGSIGHEQQDATLWASWGVDYLKYDNCGDHQGRTAPQRYEAMGAALRATGRDIVYSICDWGQEDPWLFGSTVSGNLWRTTGDISDSWDSVTSLLDQQRGLEPFARPGAWNDPDMLEVGNGGMTDAEYRAHFSFWALLNAPLIAGNDLAAMSPATRAILTNTDVIAVNQDWGGSQGRLLRDYGNGTQVWGKPMADGTVTVVLFNRNSATTTVGTSAAEIGLGGSSSYHLRDLWSKAETDTTGTISASVAGHGVAVFQVGRRGTPTAAPATGTYQVSDLDWQASANSWGPVERDRSNGEAASGDGGTITVGGATYAKGVGAHADSAVHVYLGQACQLFEAKVGVDAEAGTRGSVRFQVYGDGRLIAYTDVLRRGAAAVPVAVATKGFRDLELRVTDGRDGMDYDHADWADAKISCTGPSNGSDVSDRTWTSATNGWGPAERDQSNGETAQRDGTVLTAGGVRYPKGVGAHAESTIVVPVNGACHGIDGVVGVDAETGSAGSVTFEIVADGTSVYTSPVLASGQAATFGVPLNRPATVSLLIHATADGNTSDHGDWANPRLSCD